MAFLCCWRTRQDRSVRILAGSSPDRQRGQSQAPRFVRANVEQGGHYTLAELNQATDSFSKDRVIGSGGFGQVYKGVLSNGTKIAVKKRDPTSRQGLNEFRAEIEVCSGLRHRHLVSLLGYCEEGDEMMLVYEYMEQGTLASHLYGSLSRLAWEERLKILIEAARGLHYLHTGSEKGIIHRDVKSSNILLDERLIAKIADFGLAKIGPELGRSHVTTQVKYTPGFCDLEYFRSNHLTPESDVYGFGVVMLEVLSGRKAVDHGLPEPKVSLAVWGLKKLKRGRLQEIVDKTISDTIRSDALKMFGKIVKKCLAGDHKDRPSMEEVISELNVVQKLQDAVSSDSDIGNSVPAGPYRTSLLASLGAYTPPYSPPLKPLSRLRYR